MILPGCTSCSSASAEGRLESDDAERAALELLHLLAAGMRRVIGGDGVDGAGRDAVDHRSTSHAAAQRRLHLVVAVVGRHVAVGQREVVRRGLAGDRQAAASARYATIATECRVEMCAT